MLSGLTEAQKLRIIFRANLPIRLLRLTVRTAAFQAVNRGSIPLGATITELGVPHSSPKGEFCVI